jgi:putative lipoic acid-binding regulatory protein
MTMMNTLAGESQRMLAYPAEFHFRVICDAAAETADAIACVASEYTVTGELAESQNSRSGKYRSFSISVVFEKTEEMERFDRQIKALPGVRMLL